MAQHTLLTSVFIFFCGYILPAQHREYNDRTRKHGISDEEGQYIVPAEYDEVKIFFQERDTFYVVKKGSKKGIVNQKGQFTVPLEYQEVEMWAPQVHAQFGFALVTKDNNRSQNSGWGILNARTGNIVLPHKFEFVRVIYADLLVGRTFADSTLQFFDGQGKALFQVFGRAASAGFDDNSVEIKRVNRSTYFINKKGENLFPPQIKNPVWTNGQQAISIENGQYGLVDMAGKTLVPFEWKEMKPYNPGQFWVKNNENQQALIDKNGRFIIPLEAGNLYLPNGKLGATYIRAQSGSEPGFDFKIYDSTGKIRHSDVRISTVTVGGSIPSKADSRYEYFTAEAKGKKAQFIFHQKRGQILPEAWASVVYGGENYPLIVAQKDETGKLIRFHAFDLNGKLCFKAAEGVTLQHTRNPRLLIATNAANNTAGMVNLDKNSEKIKFEYGSISPLLNGYLTFQQADRRGLLDPNGKVLVPAKFTSLDLPNKFQFRQFRADTKVRGQLVAEGSYEGVNAPNWVAVNSKGETFVMEPTPIEESVEEVATKDSEGSDTAPESPEVEEPPAQLTNDDIFSFVEKTPEFPGGQSAMLQFLAQNIQYPEDARKNGIQGRVALSFVVEKDGSLSTIQVLRDIGGGCGQEAVRIVKMMPKWTPGMQRNRPVRVKYTLPVSFKLD